jgi:two-component system, response regulator / RNA-binding antiterminator
LLLLLGRLATGFKGRIALHQKALRIAIIAPEPARREILRAGLTVGGFDQLVDVALDGDLSAQLLLLSPDVLLMDVPMEDGGQFASYCAACRALGKPAVMLVDRSDRDMMAAAVEAGVGAYSVDGLRPERLPALVELALSRFDADLKVRLELEKARGALADRKTIERAKGLVMVRRGLSEPEAYALMRSTAMKSNQKLVEVAQSVLSADALLIEG